jgi:hypothetical protein
MRWEFCDLTGVKSSSECDFVFDRRVGEPDTKTPKKQKRYYSGKKKRHALKAQIAVDEVKQNPSRL